MRLLFVEDDHMIGETVVDVLRAENYAVDWIKDGQTAQAALRRQAYDLLLLDLALPGKDGLEVLRGLRAARLRIPVLIATARDSVEQRIAGLDAGADHYILKPCDLGELLARVRALLRRSEGTVSGEQVIEVGELTIDLPHRIVTAAGNEVHLTPTEFDLLKELALADGRPLTHKMLLRKVWGTGYAQEMQLLRTHMGRLRDKLEAQGVPRTSIETLTGVGYRLRG